MTMRKLKIEPSVFLSMAQTYCWTSFCFTWVEQVLGYFGSETRSLVLG